MTILTWSEAEPSGVPSISGHPEIRKGYFYIKCLYAVIRYICIYYCTKTCLEPFSNEVRYLLLDLKLFGTISGRGIFAGLKSVWNHFSIKRRTKTFFSRRNYLRGISIFYTQVL